MYSTILNYISNTPTCLDASAQSSLIFDIVFAKVTKCYSNYVCMINQHDALFIFTLLNYHASTCSGPICSPSSGGRRYICGKWYLFCFLVVCRRSWTVFNELILSAIIGIVLLSVFVSTEDDPLRPKYVASKFLIYKHC
jgi:hypothetical protein